MHCSVFNAHCPMCVCAVHICERLPCGNRLDCDKENIHSSLCTSTTHHSSAFVCGYGNGCGETECMACVCMCTSYSECLLRATNHFMRKWRPTRPSNYIHTHNTAKFINTMEVLFDCSMSSCLLRLHRLPHRQEKPMVHKQQENCAIAVLFVKIVNENIRRQCLLRCVPSSPSLWRE